ncbi:unnamed protein product [Ectocarpus sp. 4 AP-2014]
MVETRASTQEESAVDLAAQMAEAAVKERSAKRLPSSTPSYPQG